MKLIVRGHNLKVTPAIKAYAEKKLAKYEEHFQGITDVLLELEYNKIRNKDIAHTAKVIISLPKRVILRGEEKTNDMYAAIDLIADKMIKPLKKYHDKFKNKHKLINFFSPFNRRYPEDKPAMLAELTIKKEKNVAMKPMDPVEAVLQLSKVKKDFYVFNNTKTQHQVSVVYDRGNGTYGLQTYRDLFMQRAKLRKFKEMPATKRYEGPGVKITKIKELEAPEMTAEAAAKKLQEIKDHNFLTFTNQETKQVNVVFKKKENVFGLIEPMM